jgi:predicted Zn finger-like uncharacterized protein
MLFTRCPECDTTFRLTDETLKKANGQVRCGRCASVFNAYAELHDPSAKSFEPDARERDAPAGAPPHATSLSKPALPAADADAAEPAAGVTQGEAAPAAGAAGAANDAEAAGQSVGAASVAHVVAETERAADAAAAEPAQSAARNGTTAISATEVDRVLTAEPQPVPQTNYAWAPAHPTVPRASARRWAIAAAAALVTLAAQAVHHFRSDLAANSTFGPLLTATYDALGVTLTPTWDVRQYEILDWIATAEPNARGLGSLKITARIQNRGPLAQPYPAVQLRLKDRWEDAVGSRMFTPAEYLPRDTPRGRLMSPGETARAEIEVVDPGPDAYGFELDVCIEVEASLVTCGTDEIFL